VVQTPTTLIQRCILMTTDPGDLVLDPTCGSGTTAFVAEQWGRRWITIDTSRVALALARARIMGARYPYYLLADSPAGQRKEIDASIDAKADLEYLYDKPYTDSSRIRVAGPFTVESLSPHKSLAVDEADALVDEMEAKDGHRDRSARGPDETDFATVVLDNLRTAGVQQAHKADRITFTSLMPWPGHFISAEG